MTSKSLIIGGVMWTAVFACLYVVWQGRGVDEGSVAAGGSGVSDPTLPNQGPINVQTPNQASARFGFPAQELPEFEFEECMGGTLSLEDLKGKPWVASFIFTSCPTTCPVITASFMKLQNRVMKKNDDVMLVTFTVYPKYDTAEILKTYSETFQPKRDRWKFVTGEKDALYKVIVDGFGMYVKENVGELVRPGFEVAHSNRVVLVNEDGIPVGTFLGTRDEDMAKLAQILTGKDDFPEPGPALSISTTDGSPLQIQFDVRPVESAEGNDDEGSAPASEDAKEDSQPSNAAESDEDGAQALLMPEPKELSVAQHNALIDAKMPGWARNLPTINAGLNSLAGVLLLAGYIAIRRKQKTVHRNFMISAFLTSVAFLGCYLLYHYLLGEYTGEHGKKFAGGGMWGTVYFAILIPHVIMAALVPFMAIRVFQHAFAKRWDAHKKLAKVTFPIWMFVSVTGVAIYGMLYHWPWPTNPAVASAV